MDNQETFYEQPVDRTPYGAFVWVIAIALAVTAILGTGLWQLGSYVKSKRIGSTNMSGAADALFDKAQREGASALDQARAAAEAQANKAKNDAAAAATEELLKQKDAAITAGTEAAEEEIKTRANESFQDYLQ